MAIACLFAHVKFAEPEAAIEQVGNFVTDGLRFTPIGKSPSLHTTGALARATRIGGYPKRYDLWDDLAFSQGALRGVPPEGRATGAQAKDAIYEFVSLVQRQSNHAEPTDSQERLVAFLRLSADVATQKIALGQIRSAAKHFLKNRCSNGPPDEICVYVRRHWLSR